MGIILNGNEIDFTDDSSLSELFHLKKRVVIEEQILGVQERTAQALKRIASCPESSLANHNTI